jgi:membrane-associated phospholipid phosphatase
MHSLSIVFTKFGKFGPILLYIVASYLLWHKKTSFYYYQVGIFTCAILNLVLKGIFKEPRPSEDPTEFYLAIKNGHRFIFKNGVPHDIFGMPSGHSQTALFTTAFVFLCLKDVKIGLGFLFVSLLIMCQRVVDNWHTVFQVIVGAGVGILYAYLFYYFSQQSLKGLIRMKPDDNGPL